MNFFITLSGRVLAAALAVNHGEGEAMKMTLISPEAGRFLDTKQVESISKMLYSFRQEKKTVEYK